jgi:hypothetical protein
MRLKIYGPKGYLVSIDFQVDVGWKRKAIEFMIPTPKVPTVGAN